jgi:hypothetical protein
MILLPFLIKLNYEFYEYKLNTDFPFSTLKIYSLQMASHNFTFIDNNKPKTNYYDKQIMTNNYIISLEYQLKWYSDAMLYLKNHLGDKYDELIEKFTQENDENLLMEFSERKSSKRKYEDQKDNEDLSSEERSLKRKRKDSQESFERNFEKDQEDPQEESSKQHIEHIKIDENLLDKSSQEIIEISDNELDSLVKSFERDPQEESSKQHIEHIKINENLLDKSSQEITKISDDKIINNDNELDISLEYVQNFDFTLYDLLMYNTNLFKCKL